MATFLTLFRFFFLFLQSMAAGIYGQYGPAVRRRVGLEPWLEDELVPIPLLNTVESTARDRVSKRKFVS